MIARRPCRGYSLAAAGLSFLLLACTPAVEIPRPPADLDRRCRPEGGEGACRDGLLCVRLLSVHVVVDGRVVEADNFTCRLPCTGDSDCPPTHRCYRPVLPPMRPVCVHAEVAERLGGSPR